MKMFKRLFGSERQDIQSDISKIIQKTIMRANEVNNFDEFSLDKDNFFYHGYIGDKNGEKSVFATKKINSGEYVGCIPLTLVPHHIENICLKLQNNNDLILNRDIHYVYLNHDYNIIPYIGAFKNHACYDISNIKLGSFKIFPGLDVIAHTSIAKRDIKKDEEITIDYGVFEYEGSDFDCWCNSENCIKNFRGFKYYPQTLIDKMIKYNEISVNVALDLYTNLPESKKISFQDSYLSQLSEIDRAIYSVLKNQQ